jgi:hypothetical protein
MRSRGFFCFPWRLDCSFDSNLCPLQWILGTFSLGLKRPGLDAAVSSESIPEVKNMWVFISTPLYVFVAWCV